jgi:hypothetical protein
LPSSATDRPESPSLRPRNGRELRLSGPALVDLMRAVLGRNRSFRFRAGGGSMSPFISDGDVITVAPVLSSADMSLARPCGIGHIVAFVSPASARLVVHRIIGRRGAGLLVQGDNAYGSVTETVGRNAVLGRVVRIERGRKCVWLGLGPERYAIAVLSRAGLLLPILVRASVLIRFLRKRRYEGS